MADRRRVTDLSRECALRGALLLLCCVAFAALAVRQLKIQHFALGIDDADIFLVYARHFAHGQGFTYNPGGPRVEGFTSVLWVLIAAVPYMLGIHPQRALVGLNLLMLTAVLTAITVTIDRFSSRLGNRRFSISLASLFFLGMVCGAPAYMTWTTVTLMDLGMWSALLVALTLLVLNLTPRRARYALSAGMVLLVIARPEAMVWGPAFLFTAFLKLTTVSSRRRALHDLLVPAAIFVAALAGITLFRLRYFGYLLPNTYYAKVDPRLLYTLATGLRYFIDYALFSSGWVSLAILASLVHAGLILEDAIRSRGGPGSGEANELVVSASIVAIVSWVGLIVPILVGGDYFGGHRPYQAVYPILALNIVFLGIRLASSFGLQRAFWGRRSRLEVNGLVGLMLVFPLVSQGVQWKYFSSTSYLRVDFEVARNARTIGGFMNALFEPLPEYPRVGVFAAGGFQLSYNGPILDVLGLNDIAMGHSAGNRNGMIGHAAFNREVFFSESPEIMIPYIDRPETAALRGEPDDLLGSAANAFLKGLYADQRFREVYSYARVRRTDDGDGRWLRGFFSRSFLAQLRLSAVHEVEEVSKARDTAG